MINHRIRDIQSDYNVLCKEIDGFSKFSLEDFKKARTMVASRIFNFKQNGEETVAFVPYADMLNHRTNNQTKWYYSDEKGGFMMEAVEDISKGA